MALPGLGDSSQDIIQSDTLDSTTKAGIAAIVVGVAGALPPILKALDAGNVPRLVQFGGLVLMGLAVIGWAIATAGDALARADATAHFETTTQAPTGPVVQKPAVAEAIERASLGVFSDLKGEADRLPAIADAIRALAASQERAALGLLSDKKGVDDQRPGVEIGLQAVASALGK